MAFFDIANGCVLAANSTLLTANALNQNGKLNNNLACCHQLRREPVRLVIDDVDCIAGASIVDSVGGTLDDGCMLRQTVL